MMSRMTSNEIDQINLKLKQAKAKRERLEAIANEKRRKRDTRAKIMIGGFVVKLLSKHDETATKMSKSIIEKTMLSLSDKDKKMFQKWLNENHI